MKRRAFLSPFLLVLMAAAPAVAAPNFTEESGVRVASGVPQALTGTLPAEVRLYFTRDFQVLSATSTDGVTFVEESGVRVSSQTPGNAAVVFSSVTSASVLPLDAGGFRMLFTAVDGSGNFSINSATSSDGVAWATEALAISVPAGTFAGSVRLVEASGGGWRAFYVRPETAGIDPSTYRVFTATSGSEGAGWSAGSLALKSTTVRDLALMPLSDGGLRLLYTSALTGQTTASQVLSALSSSISNPGFITETGIRLSTDVSQGGFMSILAARAVPDQEWRLYNGFQLNSSSTPAVLSALADTPDPRSITPGSVARTAAAQSFTIAGEIFDSTPTVVLQKSGETDITGTDLVRNSDRSITVTLDTQNQSLGAWDVVVTNSDGKTGTLTGGLTIDIEAGRLAITDNVFHPVKGEQARLDITTFDQGRVRVKIYTLDGRLVRTLTDSETPAGTLTVLWDGTNDGGNRVASGTYFLQAEGPKLDVRKKIVVIK